jgi:hypothetical protein
MVIVIQRKRYWLWRAVDNEGEVLDFLVQRKRDAKAAKKLMKKLLTRLSFGRGARTDALSQPRRPPTPFQPGPALELRHFSIKSMCRCKIASHGSKSWSNADVYDESGSDSCLRDLFLGLRCWRSAR